jgi:cyclic beta-1,2-glucan synthetase
VVAIANALLEGRMRARFHAEPIVQATDLLLQERTPRDVAVAHPRAEEVKTAATVRELELPAVRRIRSPHHATPQAHLLSNGRYTVMLTAAGSGYSRWGDVGITRWREDATRDDWGSHVFLRDVQSGAVWSAGYQPTGVEPERYDVMFTEDRAELVRHDGTLTTILDVMVSPADNAEVRRVSVSNGGSRPREIDLTSYAELALAAPAADAAHPAFSKLFVQTEYHAKAGAILATRRRRSPGEPEIWAAHLAVVEGEAVGEPQIETDRARFLGRGRDIRTPMAVVDGLPLSNTTGAVLDPVFALRRRVRIPPGRTVRVAFWTLVASSRGDVLDLADKHQDAKAFERAATLAWTQAQVQLSHLGVEPDQASLFQRLAGHALYADPSLRPSPDTLRRGGGAAPALWAQGISGDLPIVLVRIDAVEDIALVRQVLRAHEYWRMKQLAVDLVILNERASSYIQDLQIALETQVRTSQSRPQVGADVARSSVFVLRSDLISMQTRDLLLSMARAVLAGRRGTLAEQLDRLQAESATPPPRRTPNAEPAKGLAARPKLEFFNGLGGFAADGREYVTILEAGRWLPAPWINVIANATLGFQAGVEGSGYTWSLGSRENQLTPWSNDPVTDRPGEVLYVRDEASGELWGPTALPIRSESAPYVAAHGQGYSRFEHGAHGVALELVQYVPLEDPIKISRLTLRNTSERTRRLSVTAYVEWVLGPSRAASALSIVTEIDPLTGALLARNPWNLAFGSRVAFADLGGRQTAWTGDRREFLGRHGTLDSPAALADEALPLSKRTGAGLDACGALQAPIVLEPGGTAEIVFFLGEAASEAEAQSLVERYRAADLDAVLREVAGFWDEVLGAIQVKTPDRSMDVMLNRWMLYQTLACRVWARAAFYQASGAYGFRDQLQDGMALALSRPALTREHLLRAAARQFVEGDVQHWWLPPSGQGVRTRISDDRVWLACAAAHYVATSGDRAVLDERVAFLEGPPLAAGEHDAYFQPMLAEERASLFEHCARARPEPGRGCARPPAHRHRRLERRHEPRRRARQRRERLARLVPARDPRRLRTAREGTRRGRARRELAFARRRAASLARARRLGRRLVPARLLRRRHPARRLRERRMPHRLHRPVLGRHLRRRRPGSRPARHGRRRPAPHPPRRRPRPPLHPALRPHPARSRLHQGLPAGHPRKRRSVHPRRRLVRPRLRRPRPGRQGRGPLLPVESHQPCEHARRRPALQGRALRRRRRHLFRLPSSRPRRMDLVHRLRRMALPRRHRIHPRLAPPGHLPPPRPLHPHLLAALRARLQIPLRPLRHHRREPATRQPRRLKRNPGRQRTPLRPGPSPPRG